MRNSVLVLLLSLAGLASAEDAVIWNGADGVGVCNTGGSWWSFGDHDNTSSSNFPVTSTKSDVVGAWVKSNGGMIDLTYTLEHSANGYAYYGIGFNFVDPEEDTPQTWSKICLEYSLSGTAKVLFQLKNFHMVTHDNDYEVRLPLQPAIAKRCFTPEDFNQPEPGRTDGTIFPIDTLLSIMRGIKFVANGNAPVGKPLVSNFKLRSITTDNGVASIRSSAPMRSLRLVQAGRTLSFQGLQGSANVQLTNTRGQILSTANLGKTDRTQLSLADFPKGIYLVRVQSQGGSYAQSIAIP